MLNRNGLRYIKNYWFALPHHYVVFAEVAVNNFGFLIEPFEVSNYHFVNFLRVLGRLLL